MIRVWRLLPKKFVERPFDFYAAFAVLGASIFSLLSPDFPETAVSEVPSWLWMIIDIYMITSSVVVLIAMSCNSKKHRMFAYFGQVWGWAFLASASISIMTYLFYNGLVTGEIDLNPLHWSLALLWGCLGWAAFFKSFGMYIDYREARINSNE